MVAATMALRTRLSHAPSSSSSLCLLRTTLPILASPRFPLTSQPFSTGSSLLGPRAGHPKNKMPQPSIRATMAAAQAQHERSGDALDHLGLVEGTLIMPTREPRLPAWTTSSSERAKLEWRRARTRVVNFLQSLYTARYQVSPRVEVLQSRRDATDFAKRAYVEMNEAVADGRIEWVEDKLAGGLAGKLKERVERRNKELRRRWEEEEKARALRERSALLATTTMTTKKKGRKEREEEGRTDRTGARWMWRLDRWIESPRLASWRFMVLPDAKGTAKEDRSGLIQAVVRLASRQSLVKVAGTREGPDGKKLMIMEDGEVVGGELALETERARNSKVVVEYLVVQRLLKRGKLGAWQVWGTAEESSLESLEKDEEAVRLKLEQYQRMKKKLPI